MKPTYRTVRFLARALVLSWIRVRVEGLDRVPVTGPCILLPNHQSVLDPLLVQGFFPREVATMTKSTQFASPLFRRLLAACRAYPVRRYRIDPQAVRMTLRQLAAGRVVCIYPEGERSWDGSLQSFRPGTIRLVLKAGVPVIPVGIDGMYEIWPRWRALPRLGRVVYLRFGTPLHFPVPGGKEEREMEVAEAERRIREALLALSGEGAREAIHAG